LSLAGNSKGQRVLLLAGVHSTALSSLVAQMADLFSARLCGLTTPPIRLLRKKP
jgi:hypothetical protein